MGERKPRWILWSAVLLIVLPILYVAGVGPAAWLSYHGWLPRDLVALVWSPLLRTLFTDSQAAWALDWYLRLWVPPDGILSLADRLLR